MRAVNFNHRPNFGMLMVTVWTNACGRCVGSGCGSSPNGQPLIFAAVIVLNYMSARNGVHRQDELAIREHPANIAAGHRGGFEMSKKISRNLGLFDFTSLQIPPKAPLLKAGCCRTFSDASLARR
jgi:hypothetical protein